MTVITPSRKPLQSPQGFFLPSPAVGGQVARAKRAQSGHAVPKNGARSAQNRRAGGAHPDP